MDGCTAKLKFGSDERETIEQAASIRGEPLLSYIRRAALEAASEDKAMQTDTIAGRLRCALRWSDRSIRSVQQELRAAGVPGTSYANVYAYFNGRTAPSVKFLAGAGEALDVNAAWLAFGSPHSVTPP